MSKFKVGDKVRIVSDIDEGIFKGLEGKIKVLPDLSGIGMYTLSGHDKLNLSLWREDELELASDKVPHKHAKLIKAWADGEKIQWKSWQGIWFDHNEPTWKLENEYRIKPESKPDIITTHGIAYSLYREYSFNISKQNVKYTFDGETGELKSVEMIKDNL